MTQEAYTIERCQHDKENPYVMINQALIRDPSISPACAYLIIYLLSLPKNWQLRIGALKSHFKGRLGREKIERCLKEAREAGYMKIEHDHDEKGHIRKRYLLSETPKFKNSDRNTEKPCDGKPCDGSPVHIRNTELKKYLDPSDHKEVCNPPPLTGSGPSADADGIVTYFIDRLKEKSPTFKPQSLKAWHRDADAIVRIDKRSPSEVREMIDWIVSDPKEWQYTKSPQSLRKRWEDIKLKMAGDEHLARIRRNRDYALEVVNKLKEKVPVLKFFSFTKTHVRNMDNQKDLSLDLPEATFKDAFFHLFASQA